MGIQQKIYEKHDDNKKQISRNFAQTKTKAKNMCLITLIILYIYEVGSLFNVGLFFFHSIHFLFHCENNFFFSDGFFSASFCVFDSFNLILFRKYYAHGIILFHLNVLWWSFRL